MDPVSVFDFPDSDHCMNCFRLLDYHETFGLCYSCEMILQPPSSWYIHFLHYDDGYITQDDDTLEYLHDDLYFYSDTESDSGEQTPQSSD